jgi:hypothetical protein
MSCPTHVGPDDVPGRSTLRLYSPVEYYDYVMNDGTPEWKWRSGFFLEDTVPEDKRRTTYKIVDKREDEKSLLKVDIEKVHNATARSVAVTLQVPILTCHDPEYANSQEWIDPSNPKKFTVDLCDANNVKVFAKVFPKKDRKRVELSNAVAVYYEEPLIYNTIVSSVGENRKVVLQGKNFGWRGDIIGQFPIYKMHCADGLCEKDDPATCQSCTNDAQCNGEGKCENVLIPKKICKGPLGQTCNTPSTLKLCEDKCERISCLCDNDDDCKDSYTCSDLTKNSELMPVEIKRKTEVLSCRYCMASFVLARRERNAGGDVNATERSYVITYTEKKVEIFFAGKTGRVKLNRAGHETEWKSFDELSPEAMAVHALFDEDLEKLSSGDYANSLFVPEKQTYDYYAPIAMETGQKPSLDTQLFTKFELDFEGFCDASRCYGASKGREDNINDKLSGDVWSHEYSSNGGGRGLIPNPDMRWQMSNQEPYSYVNTNNIRGGDILIQGMENTVAFPTNGKGSYLQIFCKECNDIGLDKIRVCVGHIEEGDEAGYSRRCGTFGEAPDLRPAWCVMKCPQEILSNGLGCLYSDSQNTEAIKFASEKVNSGADSANYMDKTVHNPWMYTLNPRGDESNSFKGAQTNCGPNPTPCSPPLLSVFCEVPAGEGSFSAFLESSKKKTELFTVQYKPPEVTSISAWDQGVYDACIVTLVPKLSSTLSTKCDRSRAFVEELCEIDAGLDSSICKNFLPLDPSSSLLSCNATMAEICVQKAKLDWEEPGDDGYGTISTESAKLVIEGENFGMYGPTAFLSGYPAEFECERGHPMASTILNNPFGYPQIFKQYSNQKNCELLSQQNGIDFRTLPGWTHKRFIATLPSGAGPLAMRLSIMVGGQEDVSVPAVTTLKYSKPVVDPWQSESKWITEDGRFGTEGGYTLSIKGKNFGGPICDEFEDTPKLKSHCEEQKTEDDCSDLCGWKDGVCSFVVCLQKSDVTVKFQHGPSKTEDTWDCDVTSKSEIEINCTVPEGHGNMRKVWVTVRGQETAIPATWTYAAPKVNEVTFDWGLCAPEVEDKQNCSTRHHKICHVEQFNQSKWPRTRGVPTAAQCSASETILRSLRSILSEYVCKGATEWRDYSHTARCELWI